MIEQLHCVRPVPLDDADRDALARLEMDLFETVDLLGVSAVELGQRALLIDRLGHARPMIWNGTYRYLTIDATGGVATSLDPRRVGPTWRTMVHYGRCLVPVTGLRFGGGEPLTLGGVCMLAALASPPPPASERESPASFTLLLDHHGLPAWLPVEAWEVWLGGSCRDALALLMGR